MKNKLVHLFVELLGSETGISESQYNALLNVLSISPLAGDVVAQLLNYVCFNDGFFFIYPDDAAFILETLVED